MLAITLNKKLKINLPKWGTPKKILKKNFDSMLWHFDNSLVATIFGVLTYNSNILHFTIYNSVAKFDCFLSVAYVNVDLFKTTLVMPIIS